MYIGIYKSTDVHNYVGSSGDITSLITKMRQELVEEFGIEEFDESLITFYSARELIVQKNVFYTIISEIME